MADDEHEYLRRVHGYIATVSTVGWPGFTMRSRASDCRGWNSASEYTWSEGQEAGKFRSTTPLTYHTWAQSNGGENMAAQLNHTIVWSSDQMKSATFLAEMLGRPAPTRFAHFDVVELDNGVSLDFANADGPIRPQHYAFLISEADFDAVLGRIRERGLDHWADPMRRRPGEINHNDGGRGVYFPDPDGHGLEVITRPYGGGAG